MIILKQNNFIEVLKSGTLEGDVTLCLSGVHLGGDKDAL